MSDHSPIRPPRYYEEILKRWRVAGILHGLTDSETILLAAQFAGLAVAAAEVPIEEQEAQIEVAIRALRTAYAGRMMVKQGYGRAVVKEPSH